MEEDLWTAGGVVEDEEEDDEEAEARVTKNSQ